jgi:iron complex outermembrane receptor protein
MRHTAPTLKAVFVPCLLSAAISSVASAQSARPDTIEEVLVRAHPLSAEGLAQPATVLGGDELQRALASSLSETLSDVPGVHSSSFGQMVGRPVIRGLGGPRIKILEDRVDSLDVSVTSPDHVTTIEPFTADSIEVLKGPSTLLYGTGAIGGIVNVNTGRIPHEVPETLSGKAEIRGADNADQQTAAGRLVGGAGNFAFHVGGFYRDAEDYEIPGFAESARLRAMEEEEHDEEHDEEHGDEHEHGEEKEAFGILEGSHLEVAGGSFGTSYVGDRGFAGLSVSAYEAEYGLPGHSHEHHDHGEEEHGGEHGDEEHDHEEHDHEEGEEAPPILDLEQTRIDFEAGLDAPVAGIHSLNLRVGYNDYEHVEFEEGEPGTEFTTEAWEGRFELRHEAIGGIEGAAGVQVSYREFAALGEEAFVKPVDTATLGAFYVGEANIGDLAIEAGVRYEHVDHDPTEGFSRDFDLGAVSLGLIQPLGENWTLSGQVDYSSRAPAAEELFSNGPHLITESFEIGDPSLEEEVAANLSANLRYVNESLVFSLGAYVTEFSDFIYQADTGLEEDGLEVLQWVQADATFTGLEVDATWQAMSWQGGGLALNAGFDTVQGSLDNSSDEDLPRIPPQRWRLGAVLDWNNLLAEVTYRYVDDQDDVAFGELPTDSYDDLRIHLGYTIEMADDNNIELFVSGRNLTDDEQRHHASFIKDVAPQPGRTVEAGVRIEI